MKSFAAFAGILFISVQLLIVAGCKKNDNPTPAGKTPGLQLITDNLVSPVAVAEPPDSTHRLFVVDETGKIWIIGANGTKLTTPFIDLTSKMVTLSPSYDERDCLGSPSPRTSRRTVNYTCSIRRLPVPALPNPALPGQPGTILPVSPSSGCLRRIQTRRT